MMPGMRGGDPRQMKMAMKRMGITQEDIPDVQEVIIRTSGKRYVLKKPDVVMITMQGQKTFQVVGEYELFEGAGSPDTGGAAAAEETPALQIPDEDIILVAQQANVSAEEAKKALEECNGEPAEAIIKLMS